MLKKYVYIAEKITPLNITFILVMPTRPLNLQLRSLKKVIDSASTRTVFFFFFLNDNTSAGKDSEKVQLPFFACGNAEWYSHCGKQVGTFL